VRDTLWAYTWLSVPSKACHTTTASDPERSDPSLAPVDQARIDDSDRIDRPP
jgi:hypothetical protein